MKNERKLYAFLLSVMLVSIGLTALATRTITDTSDSVYTSIVTSAGGVYAATSTGLLAAVVATNGTKGIVNVPPGYYDISTDFSFYKMTLKGSGSGSYTSLTGVTQFNLTGNNTIAIGSGGSLQDIKVVCPTGHGDTAIRVYSNGVAGGWNDYFWQQSEVLKNVYILKTFNTNGTAINITGKPTGVASAKIALSTFGNVRISGFKYGISIFAEDVGGVAGYVNGNIFSDITFNICRNGIFINENNNGEVTQNIFDNVLYQTDANNERCFYILEADDNEFRGVKVFDVTAGEVVNLSSTCEGNVFDFNQDISITRTNFDDNLIEKGNIIKTRIPDIVFLPAGEIQLDNFFTPASDTKYVGAGIGKTILHQNGFGVVISSKKNITFSDLTIHGNAGTRGIQITGSSSNITIMNVEINGSSNGIEIDTAGTGSNIIITNCIIHGCTDGVDIEAGFTGNHTLISNNIFYSNTNNINDNVLSPLRITRTNNIGCYDYQLPIRAPEDPVAGMIWVNSTTGIIMYYYGAGPTLGHIHP